MKRLIIALMLIMSSCIIYAQYTSDSYLGTWVYQSKDTVFTIKIQKTVLDIGNEKMEIIVGGYSLKINGVLTDNYIGNPPKNWEPTSKVQGNDIYIYGGYSEDNNNPSVYFHFFDQKKKHFEGKEPIGGGRMKLISPTQLRWTLNEEEGIDDQEGSPYGNSQPIGFSVPTDVIMTKEELKPKVIIDKQLPLPTIPIK